MKYDGIIFDLDGTLWDSTDGICGTWKEVLKEYPEVKADITSEMLHSCMGLPLDEISNRLFPDLSSEMRKKLMDRCCELENKYLAVHGGTLYPELENVLEKLSSVHSLYIVSNCQKGYIESFFEGHRLGRYFKDKECAGSTGFSKGKNIRLVIERNNLKNVLYVGDTQGDADAAREAEIPFVFAEYGFGTVSVYDYIIHSIAELQELDI